MKPRVLMIISFFYPHLGGAEQQALRLAEQLRRRGIQVCVLTRKFKGLPAHEIVQGVPVYRAIRTLPRGKWFAVTYMLSVLWFLMRRRHTYDIIHCHLLQGFHSLAAIVMKTLFKKKVIIKVGATGPLSDFKLARQGLLGNFIVKSLLHTDRIVTVCSQGTEEALQAGFPLSRVIQIPNGVDTDYFQPLSFSEHNRNSIVFIGRLDTMKGAHVLIDAIRTVRDKGLPIYVSIIGDGPDRKHLEKRAAALMLTNCIEFIGEVGNIGPYLQKSALFVLPSFSEGLSNVLLEAMACGLPVIATTVGGNTDILQDGVNGILVEPNNVGQLYQAIMRILQDEDLAKNLGKHARQTIEEKFTMNYVSDQYLNLYRQLLLPT